MAKKKAEDMRGQLKNIISFTRKKSAWEELLRTEADIRKKRQKLIYDQQERQRRKVLNAIAIIFLVLLIAGVFVFGLYTYSSN